ncbi:MAG: sterol desaturase family protein [Deltaproteobacteria bacterium]
MAFIRYTHDCLEAGQGRWPAAGDARVLRGEKLLRERPKQIQIFENRLLDFVGRAHPLTPFLWFLPIISWAMWTAPARLGLGRSFVLFGEGLFLWSAMEYGLHRFLMHGLIHQNETPEQRFRGFMVHGYHHEFPDDPMHLVMPPLVSWPLALGVGLLYRLAYGPHIFWPVLAGTMAGYLAYDEIHYYTHHARPRTWLGKWLRQYHMRHHFEHEDSRFGISNPLWDFVFGTFRSNRRAPEKDAPEPPPQEQPA